MGSGPRRLGCAQDPEAGVGSGPSRDGCAETVGPGGKVGLRARKKGVGLGPRGKEEGTGRKFESFVSAKIEKTMRLR